MTYLCENERSRLTENQVEQCQALMDIRYYQGELIPLQRALDWIGAKLTGMAGLTVDAALEAATAAALLLREPLRKAENSYEQARIAYQHLVDDIEYYFSHQDEIKGFTTKIMAAKRIMETQKAKMLQVAKEVQAYNRLIAALKLAAAAIGGLVLAYGLLQAQAWYFAGKLQDAKDRLKELKEEEKQLQKELEDCINGIGNCASCSMTLFQEELTKCLGCGRKYCSGCFDPVIQDYEMMSRN